MGPIRVFVSSPALGLEDERAAVKAALERMRGTVFAGMELFGSRHENAKRASLEEVDEAQLYVGIIGGRYGSGITRAEYERARERDLRCLLYLQNENAVTLRDDDPAVAQARTEWIASVTDPFNGHVVSRFSSPEELATKVAADVHSWIYRKLARETKAAASAGALLALRALLAQTRNADDLRKALLADGFAAGDDLLDSLLALSPVARERLVEGIRDLPADYAARIENFLDAYIGTPEAPVPFGGRAGVFEDLDAWLEHDAAHPYLLVAAAAGRGKTAALVRWTRRHVGNPDVEVVFVPVSIRFRTNLAGVFFPALAARLARVHGDEVPNDANVSAEVWRGMVAAYLRQPLPDGRKLVVVLDGLDEAAGWEAGPDLFPARPPKGLRVLLSARLTVDLPTPESWMDQLGWDARTARTLSLQSLTREGVRDVVIGMGCPLSELGEDIIGELYRLSEGDPLLIRLYVDDLWLRGGDAVRLKAEDLAAIAPGLDGFFDRWWREQKKLWGDESPLKERGVRALLDLLATAMGPLRREDILTLAETDAGLTTWTLDDAVEPVRRFVIEGSSGLVFSHPRFGQYLASRLTESERRGLHSRFAEWSRKVRESMNNGALSPVDAPPYVVLFSGVYLEQMHAGAEELCTLLTPEWRTAWDAAEGSLAGFSTDVDRVWHAARREDERLLAAGAAPAALPIEVLCYLLQARIRSLAQSFPPALIGRMVEEKLWRPRQAAAYARTMPVSAGRVKALAEASRFADEHERELLLEEARATLPQIEDEDDREDASIDLLRAGISIDEYFQLPSRSKEWLPMAFALLETGRALEIPKLGREVDSNDVAEVLDTLLDRQAVREAEIVCRELNPRLISGDTVVWRFALHGIDTGEPSAERRFVPRIHELQQQAMKASPLRLKFDDLQWIEPFLAVQRPSPDLIELGNAVVAAVDEELRALFRSEVHDLVARARLRLADPKETLAYLKRELSGNGSDRLARTASIADRNVIRAGIRLLSKELWSTDRPRELLRTYLSVDPDAFRAAIASIPVDSWPGSTLVAIAATIDPEFRQTHLRQFVAMLREDEWDEDYDFVAPMLDRATLLAIAELFGQLGDTRSLEAMRFIFDPFATKALSEDRLAAVSATALFVPEHTESLIRAAVQHAKPDPLVLVLFDAIAEVLPPTSAAEIRRSLRSHVIGKLRKPVPTSAMLALPALETVTACLEQVPRESVESKSQEFAEKIAAILQLPPAQRQPAVAALEKLFKTKRFTTLSVLHIAGELSKGTIARVLKRVTEKALTGGTRTTLLAIAQRITETQARALYNFATPLSADDRAILLTPCFDRLPQPERSAAVAWMLSIDALPFTAERLLETATYRPEVRSVLVESITGMDVVAALHAVRNTAKAELLLPVVVRSVEFDTSTARKLALAIVDSRSQETSTNAWAFIGTLRLLLVRSGDESLFPAISTAVDRATTIFP